MASLSSRRYDFGGFRIDAVERSLFDSNKPVSLPPKVFDTLLMLVENQGKVVSKERMLEEIWEGSFVEENNLARMLSPVRIQNKNKKPHLTMRHFGIRQ